MVLLMTDSMTFQLIFGIFHAHGAAANQRSEAEIENQVMKILCQALIELRSSIISIIDFVIFCLLIDDSNIKTVY